MGKVGTNSKGHQYCTYPRRIPRPKILRLREEVVKLLTYALFINMKIIRLDVLEEIRTRKFATSRGGKAAVALAVTAESDRSWKALFKFSFCGHQFYAAGGR